MEQFDRTVKGALSVIDNNEYLSSALSLFLILYAGLAAPQLPEYVARLFDNPLFKLLIFFLIAYSAQKNPTVAIIASIGLMVSLHTLTRFKVNRQMVSMVAAEEAAAQEAAAQEAAAQEAAAQGPIEGYGAEELDMESVSSPEEGIPEAALAELLAESGAPLEVAMDGVTNIPSCAKRANFRNSFYPQYVNMKPDSYDARFTGGDVSGYDASAAYASI